MADDSGYGERTLALGVKNVAFLLERIHQDCARLQYIRELTHNSVQSILRRGGTGTVIWDVDWHLIDLAPGSAYKLCVSDDGTGMTGEEMLEYINHLASSIEQQAFDKNFGIGAKIAAAPINQAGLTYLSWKNAKGYMTQFWKDPITGIYGLREFRLPGQPGSHWAEIPPDLKSDPIKDNGTKVVLLGANDDEDTANAPKGTRSPSKWISRYLNGRYFQFPTGITVRVREGWTFPRGDQNNRLRTVTGQGPWLDENCLSKGRVELQGAVARWWIIPERDEKKHRYESIYYAASGHVAALFQDELYEMCEGRAGIGRLQQFGVVFGGSQVVIYVEPNQQLGAISPNTSRTALVVDQRSLPWTEWGIEFREKMPPEIETLMEAKAGTGQKDRSKTIRDRLKDIVDLFKVIRYRRSKKGVSESEQEDVVRVGSGIGPGNGGNPRGTGAGGGRGKGTTGAEPYLIFAKAGGVTSDAIQPDLFPKVRWISATDKSLGRREPGDLEDRAARYVPVTNEVLANADFRGFSDLVEKVRSRFTGVNKATAIAQITEEVREWVEQALMETVAGIKAMATSPEWSAEDINAALSEESLTAAVMQRYHLNIAVKRAVHSTFGKPTVAV